MEKPKSVLIQTAQKKIKSPISDLWEWETTIHLFTEIFSESESSDFTRITLVHFIHRFKKYWYINNFLLYACMDPSSHLCSHTRHFLHFLCSSFHTFLKNSNSSVFLGIFTFRYPSSSPHKGEHMGFTTVHSSYNIQPENGNGFVGIAVGLWWFCTKLSANKGMIVTYCMINSFTLQIHRSAR